MTETADVIIVGAGVHGASLAYHLAQRGASVLVLEMSVVAAGATGRSSGFVRMHYDLEVEARLAWASFPYFRDWSEMVGGDCGFRRTGFLQLVGPELADSLRANVAVHQRIGIRTRVVGTDEVRRLVPGILAEDVAAAAYEPESGYADPTSTTTGFLAAARATGARLIQGCRVTGITVAGERVTGLETGKGRFGAPVIVDAAGPWAAEVAGMVGLEIPLQVWRHDTAYLGRPSGQPALLPVVIDEPNASYFRPEGTDLLLVGLADENEVGGPPDREDPVRPRFAELVADRICRRLPAMAGGTFRVAHSGRDGITPDQRAILDQAGPEGFYLACGFSGTGFKTAPAVGACMAELIVDGRATTVDIGAFTLRRFAEGRPLVGAHSYGRLWRMEPGEAEPSIGSRGTAVGRACQ